MNLHDNTFFRQVYLFLTHECPLRCEYCYIDRSKSFPDMKYSTIQYFMDNVRSKFKGGRGLVFFGGEPLLRVDLIERTVKDYYEAIPGGIGGVVTSATINMDKFFPIYRDYELDMQVSYDGMLHNKTRKSEFDFGSLMPYLELSEKRFQLRKTVSDANIDTLYEDYLFGRKIHIEFDISFDYAVAHQASYSKYFHDKLFDKQTKIWNFINECIEKDIRTYIPLTLIKDLYHIKEYIASDMPAGRLDSCEVGNILAIDTDGSCYPCTMLSQLGDEFKIGDIWSGIDISKNSSIREYSNCNCMYSNVCGGGCRWERYKIFGKNNMANSVNPEHCKTLHIKYTTAMNFWKNLNDKHKPLIESAIRTYSVYQKLTFDQGRYHEAHSMAKEAVRNIDTSGLITF